MFDELPTAAVPEDVVFDELLDAFELLDALPPPCPGVGVGVGRAALIVNRAPRVCRGAILL